MKYHFIFLRILNIHKDRNKKYKGIETKKKLSFTIDWNVN